jgi:Tol biopolymer transport system component
LSDRVLYPSWYPNGDQLAVLDARDEVIKRIDLTLGTAVTVTDHQQVLTGMPSVLAGRQVDCVRRQRNTGQPYDQTKNSIWLVSDVGALRTVEPAPASRTNANWSPDGQWLAFESNRGSSDQSYAAFIIVAMALASSRSRVTSWMRIIRCGLPMGSDWPSPAVTGKAKTPRGSQSLT